jgi:hypothetical protein
MMLSRHYAETRQDAEDAVAYAMLECIRRHDQIKGDFFVYAFVVARCYLAHLRTCAHTRRTKNFTTLTPAGADAEQAEGFIEALAHTSDIYADREIDYDMLELVRNRLNGKSDWILNNHRGKSPAQAARAIRILDTFVRSAENDCGIGVDEYDNRSRQRQRIRDYRNERAAVRNAMMNEERINHTDYDRACAALRDATEEELRRRSSN